MKALKLNLRGKEVVSQREGSVQKLVKQPDCQRSKSKRSPLFPLRMRAPAQQPLKPLQELSIVLG